MLLTLLLVSVVLVPVVSAEEMQNFDRAEQDTGYDSEKTARILSLCVRMLLCRNPYPINPDLSPPSSIIVMG